MADNPNKTPEADENFDPDGNTLDDESSDLATTQEFHRNETVEGPEQPPLKGAKILIAGNFDDVHIKLLYKQLKRMGATDISLASTGTDTMQKLGGLDFVLHDGELFGGLDNLVDFVEHTKEMTGEEPVRCIISSNKIHEQSDHSFDKTLLEKLQGILLPHVHVLVVHSGEEVRNSVKQSLMQTALPEGNVQDTGNYEYGMELASEKVTDVIELNGERIEIQDDVALVCVEESPKGAEFVKSLLTRDITPYIAAISGPNADLGTWKNMDLPEAFVTVDQSDFTAQVAQEIIPKSRLHVNRRWRSLYEKALRTQERYESRYQIIDTESQVILSPSVVIPPGQYINMKKQLPDLRLPEYQNVLAAVLDLDGTMSAPFTMARFVEAFTTPAGGSEYDRLLEELPPDSQERNRRALQDLNNELRRWSEMKKEGKEFSHEEYQAFIENTDNYYAQMLQDLKTTDVCTWGDNWCHGGDAESNIYSHAKPLVRLLKECYIMPTLVTGTPTEAVSGFRSVLGIDERCHPLELESKDGRYTGKVKYHTGLTKSKSKLMSKMSNVVFGAGDSKSDFELIHRAISPDIDNLLGYGIYFGPRNHVLEDMGRKHRQRQVEHINTKDIETEPFIKIVVTGLLSAMHDNLQERNLNTRKAELVGRTRDKLDEFFRYKSMREELVGQFDSKH